MLDAQIDDFLCVQTNIGDACSVTTQAGQAKSRFTAKPAEWEDVHPNLLYRL